MKASFLKRATRAFFRLPEWLRPAVFCAALVPGIVIVRAVGALPELLTGRGAPLELALALGAAVGAGFLGGLVHGLSRPGLRRLGRAGDYLSGVAILYGYLGSLMLASPYVFESSAIPEDAQGAWIWLGMATVLGLVAGHAWFAGPNGLDRIRERRSAPRLERLVEQGGTRTATVVSGWIRRAGFPGLVEELARALGGALPPGELARLEAAVAALDEDDDDGLEWRLPAPFAAQLHVIPDEEIVGVDVLLEGELERSSEAVHALFRTRTVDPLAA